MHRTVCAFVLLPLLAAGGTPPPTEWAAVERIAAGERIEVQLSTGKTVKGRIDHATADAAYLTGKEKTVEVRRVDVQRLSRRKAGHGGSGALIGGAAGAALLGAYGGTHLESGPSKGFGAAVAGVAVVGALVGAGVGYGIGHGRLELVYQAPK